MIITLSLSAYKLSCTFSMFTKMYTHALKKETKKQKAETCKWNRFNFRYSNIKIFGTYKSFL